MKQFGNPPFLSKPPFQLTPLFLSNFLMTPLCPNFKSKNPSLILRGGNYVSVVQA